VKYVSLNQARYLQRRIHDYWFGGGGVILAEVEPKYFRADFFRLQLARDVIWGGGAGKILIFLVFAHIFFLHILPPP